jgi:hypothetical protein
MLAADNTSRVFSFFSADDPGDAIAKKSVFAMF